MDSILFLSSIFLSSCVGFVVVFEIKYSTKFSNSSGFISFSVVFFFFLPILDLLEKQLGIDVSDYDFETNGKDLALSPDVSVEELLPHRLNQTGNSSYSLLLMMSVHSWHVDGMSSISTE